MWTDDYRKTGYLCVTLRYINSKLVLIERVLCTSQWNNELRKTADNIKAAIINALNRQRDKFSCSSSFCYTVELLFPHFQHCLDNVFGEEVTAFIDSQIAGHLLQRDKPPKLLQKNSLEFCTHDAGVY